MKYRELPELWKDVALDMAIVNTEIFYFENEIDDVVDATNPDVLEYLFGHGYIIVKEKIGHSYVQRLEIDPDYGCFWDGIEMP